MKAAIKIMDSRLTGRMLPTYETENAAAMDLRACIHCPVIVDPGDTVLISAGFSMSVPEGFVAILAPRSGLGHKHGIILGNTVGVIDGDYRGQVMVSVWNRRYQSGIHDAFGIDTNAYRINPMDRIAQMLIAPVARMEWEIVDELPPTARGAGGFGSTGR